MTNKAITILVLCLSRHRNWRSIVIPRTFLLTSVCYEESRNLRRH